MPARLVAAAMVWGVLLIVLGIVLPVYTVSSTHGGAQPRHSLVRVFGYRVLALVAIPLLISIVVGSLLRFGRAGDRRWPGIVAWIMAGATIVGAIVGFLTFVIGIYVLPIGILLWLAADPRGLPRLRKLR